MYCIIDLFHILSSDWLTDPWNVIKMYDDVMLLEFIVQGTYMPLQLLKL
jgi:hypothetical protein